MLYVTCRIVLWLIRGTVGCVVVMILRGRCCSRIVNWTTTHSIRFVHDDVETKRRVAGRTIRNRRRSSRRRCRHFIGM
jgi:hypothetical protein